MLPGGTELYTKNKIIKLTIFMLLYAIFVAVGVEIHLGVEQVAPFWPASAVLLAALYYFDRKDHPLIYILAIIPHTLLNMYDGSGFLLSFLFSLANIGTSFLQYEFLLRVSPNLLEFDDTFEILYFIVSGFVKSLVAATLGAISMSLLTNQTASSIEVIKVWATAEWVCLLYLTPVFFVFAKTGISLQIAKVPNRKLAEGFLLALYILGIAIFAQTQMSDQREFLFKYLAMPGIIWSLFRFRTRTNFYVLLGFFLLLVANLLENEGLFRYREEELKTTILDMNLYASVIASISLFILVSLNQQKRGLRLVEDGRKKLKAIFENAPVPYIILDGSGKIMDCNEEFCKMFNDKGECNKNKKITDLLTEDSAERFDRFLASGKDELEDILEFLNSAGEKIIVHFKMRKNSEFEISFYCSMENITEKHQIETAARSAEERYRYLFDHSPEGILVLDPNSFRVIEYNLVAAELIGAGENANYNFLQLLKLNKEEEKRLFDKVNAGEIFTGSVSFGKPGNTRAYLELTLSKVVINKKRSLICLIRDVTTQKKSERTRKLNRLRLESLLRLKESLSGNNLEFLGEIAEEAKAVTEAKESIAFFFDEGEVLVAHYKDEILLSSAFRYDEFITSQIAIEWSELFNSDIPFMRIKEIYGSNGSNTNHFIGYPALEMKYPEIAIGVVSQTDYDEGDLDHFTLFCESIKSVVSKNAADLENRYLLLAVQQNTASIVITDTKGNIKYVNPQFEKITGYSFEEVKGKNPRVLKSGETPPDEYKTMWETISTGEGWKGVFHNKKKNGELYWESASLSPIKDHLGIITGYLAIKNDITVERQMEQDLTQREKRFHTLWEHSLDPMRLTDSEGKLVMVNEAYCKLFGLSKADMIGKNFTDYLDESAYQNARERYKAKFAARSIPNYQESLLHLKNGDKIWVNILSRFMEYDDGEMLLLAIFRDITDIKRRESELNDARQKAETMNRLKSIFLANMSHELRTPLINIMGYAEILMDEVEDEGNKEMLSSIVNGGERLRDTLNSLLDLSNLESDKTDTLFSVHDLNSLAQKIFREFEEAAKLKRLRYEIELSDVAPLALLDEKLLSQVLRNLVNNAIKYTDSGFVKVVTGISGSGKQKTAFLKVVDSGIGIPDEMKEQIFEPFRQVSEGNGRKYEGAGLGLTIARKYVELMAGELTVESQFGSGSIFEIGFISENEVTGEDEESDNPDKKKILIVEDDAVCANLMKMYLLKSYDITVAHTGEEALELLSEDKFDILILDINLPGGMSGVEIAHIVREMEVYQKTPLVAITAFSLPGDQQRFLESGFQCFVEKPFKRDDFISRINELMKD